MILYDDEHFAHYGVKGMHWGVRNKRPAGVSAKTNREARRDAEEFARAKMFYGQGAGNRRKLIKNTVDAKAKRSPSYKKAFDAHLTNQSMDRHAEKARSERKRTDRKEGTRRTAGALARRFTGEMGTNAAFVGVALAGASYLASPQGRAKTNVAMTVVKSAANEARRRQGAAATARLLRDLM